MKKFKHPEESSVTLSILMLPSHSNFSGKIHGGYILSLIDQIAFACASKHCGNYCVVAKDQKTGKSTPVPGLIVNSENEMRRFARAVKRREMNKERRKELKVTDFKKPKFKKALAGHNVKIKF